MYGFDFDARTQVLHITMRGFWSLDLVARFAADAFAKGAQIRRSHDGFAVLSDARECPVQSGDVAAALSEVSLRSSAVNPAPNASVVSSSLLAIQGRRVLTPPNYRIFLDYDEAVGWIDAEWVRRRDRR